MRVFAFWVAKGKGVVNGTRNPRVLGSYVYPSYYLYVSTPWVPKLPCCSNQLVVMGVQLGRFSALWDSYPHGYHKGRISFTYGSTRSQSHKQEA